MNTKWVLFLFMALISSIFGQHSFTVDFSQIVGPIKDLTNANRAELEIYGDGYRDAAISSVRLHDYHGANDYCFYSSFWNYNDSTKLYSSINQDFDPNNPIHYNWGDYDATLQELKDFNISPYIRLGSSYPNPSYQLQPLAPPLDPDGIGFTKFAQLCKRTVMHTNAGWDNGTQHNVKYWEIWNEPGGLFWEGTPIQFYKMFEAVADTLKTNFPFLKFGGPGAHPSTTLEVYPEYGNNFLNYLKENEVPLDFYSWHIYGIKNPYFLFEVAERIRTKLDSYGFTNAESHLTEINHELSGDEFQYFDFDARGTAYYASLIIAAQNSSIDKLFWYPGKAFFEDDGYNYSWLGYSVTAYSMILKEAPLQIFSSGDLVVQDNMTVDTTNIMMLASKSFDDEKVYLLLSNYNSNKSNFKITLNNLPWQNTDSIRVVQNTTKNQDIRFAEFTRVIKGNNSLELNVQNMPAPSVMLIRLEKKNPTDLKQDFSDFLDSYELKQNYPNPFNPSTTIKYSIPAISVIASPVSQGRSNLSKIATSSNKTWTPRNDNINVTLKIYNILGQEVATLVNKKQAPGRYEVEFDASNLTSGIYIYRLVSGKFISSKKLSLLK